jgi:hypothetical protein
VEVSTVFHSSSRKNSWLFLAKHRRRFASCTRRSRFLPFRKSSSSGGSSSYVMRGVRVTKGGPVFCEPPAGYRITNDVIVPAGGSTLAQRGAVFDEGDQLIMAAVCPGPGSHVRM